LLEISLQLSYPCLLFLELEVLVLEDVSELLDLIHDCERFLRGMQASLINLEGLQNLMLLLHEPLLELLDPLSELGVLMVEVVVLSGKPIEFEAKLFKELLVTLLLPE
jgi:hypothetical protein